MANKTAWIAGAGAGLTWTSAFTTETGTMATANSVLSNTTIANQTALDQYADISVRLSIASSTVAAGANFALWIATLLDDGTTYGDGQLTAGTPAAITIPWAPCAVIPLFAAATQTNLRGSFQGIILPPESFKFIIQNNSGFALTATVQSIMYKTYNINLNA